MTTTPVCSPFTVGSKVTDRRFFVGRRTEVDFIMQKMAGDQPTSVNVFGDRRIGKSSLLCHIAQTYEERVLRQGKQPEAYVVLDLSLQAADCRNQGAFYQAVANRFLALPKVQGNASLVAPLQGAMDAVSFAAAMRLWRSVGVLPVICLDNFEELLAKPGQQSPSFDDDFYDNLRHLMDDRALMLIVASRETVQVHSQRRRLTSDFFNGFQMRRLEELTASEAQQLIALPDINNPILSDEHQTLALGWAGFHPCLLQLAGDVLFEAEQRRQNDKAARRAFEVRRQGIYRRMNGWQQMARGIQRVGALGQDIGDTIDDWGNFAKGMVIIILVALLGLGVASFDQVKGWVKKVLIEIVDSAE
jgi:uncharacterized protein